MLCVCVRLVPRPARVGMRVVGGWVGWLGYGSTLVELKNWVLPSSLESRKSRLHATDNSNVRILLVVLTPSRRDDARGVGIGGSLGPRAAGIRADNRPLDGIGVAANDDLKVLCKGPLKVLCADRGEG